MTQSSLNAAFFIDVPYIKTWYAMYVDENLDDNTLATAILIAQDQNLQSCIGYDLYNVYIQALIIDKTGATTLNTQQLFLLNNYIQKSVGLWAIWQALPTINWRITNKAVSTKTSDYSQPSGIKEVEYLRDGLRNNAQFMDERIREYITNNPTYFPQYWTQTGINRIPAKANNYFGGIYLPQYPTRRGNRGQGYQGCCNDYNKPGIWGT